MSARVVQVIETKLERRGKGTPDDVVRLVTQWWRFDGTLLFEDDPVGAEYGLKDRLHEMYELGVADGRYQMTSLRREKPVSPQPGETASTEPQLNDRINPDE